VSVARAVDSRVWIWSFVNVDAFVIMLSTMPPRSIKGMLVRLLRSSSLCLSAAAFLRFSSWAICSS